MGEMIERDDEQLKLAEKQGDEHRVFVDAAYAPSSSCEPSTPAGSRAWEWGHRPSFGLDTGTWVVYEYGQKTTGKRKYFDKAPEATRCRKAVVEGFFDPVQRVMDALSKISGGPVNIAVEEGYGKYFAGLVRRIEKGTLVHVDYAPNEQSDWMYVRLPDRNPGAISVWDRHWQRDDERYKLPGLYGCSRACSRC